MNYNYLNNIINKLVDETIMDDQGRQTHTPFGSFPYFYHLSILEPFMNHCKDVYGLTSEEIKYAWVKYRSIIDTKIKRGRSLNESQELNYKYLNKVVDILLDETIIESGQIVNISWANLSSHLPVLFFGRFFYNSFHKHVRDMYGLTVKETEYVWIVYRNMVNNKIQL